MKVLSNRSLSKLRVRRFSGLFWPIFDFLRGGNINFVYDPRVKNRKVGSKEPENRTSLSFERDLFKAWESIEFFNQVHIDPKTDTLAWGNEIDLDPYVLREKIVKI